MRYTQSGVPSLRMRRRSEENVSSLPIEHLLPVFRAVGVAVVAIDDVVDRQLEQLRFRIAQHRAQLRVHFQDRFGVRGVVHDADRRMIEGRAVFFGRRGGFGDVLEDRDEIQRLRLRIARERQGRDGHG